MLTFATPLKQVVDSPRLLACTLLLVHTRSSRVPYRSVVGCCVRFLPGTYLDCVWQRACLVRSGNRELFAIVYTSIIGAKYMSDLNLRLHVAHLINSYLLPSAVYIHITQSFWHLRRFMSPCCCDSRRTETSRTFARTETADRAIQSEFVASLASLIRLGNGQCRLIVAQHALEPK